ncbi:MAG: type II secretion system protein [Planctomycetes bacterium]|nr:type II secretion system protein [Planctomycetota bacterium]
MISVLRLRGRPKGKAFTLIEVLVSMSILIVLGLALMLILRGGLATWRRSEAKRESYDRAQAVLLQLRDDFTNALAPVESPLRGLGETEARMVCENDPETGRTRLFLVRSLKAEAEHPITGHAGSTIAGDATLDQRNDLMEARQSRLRATGGAMEVAWVLGPDGVLYRGIRSPIGPPQSLFDPGAFELAPLLPANPPPTAEAASAPAPVDASTTALLRPFALEVIHFECLFWSQFTHTWSTKSPALRDPRGDEVSGPLEYWDSTRALLSFQGASRREYHTFKSPGSLDDARDDVFPASVQVTLILREPDAALTTTFLAVDLGAGDRELIVEDGTRLPDKGHVFVDSEWLRYDSKSKNTLHLTHRAARNTLKADHKIAAAVTAGKAFTVAFDVPAWREDWSERRR